MGNAEESVSRFYNTVGWQAEGDVTEDARRWEDLRESARDYVSKCRLRVLRHIPPTGANILDMASGPIQYVEYLEFSRNFDKRYCVDLSSTALDKAKKRIGSHGVFLHGSFLDLPLEEAFFDCTVSLHTIYHIDKDRQEEAVRKLIHVTKPGGPVIIVYRNPNTIVSSLRSRFGLLRRARNLLARLARRRKERTDAGGSGRTGSEVEVPSLYFYPHPLEWWNRFGDVARVRILPWRSFEADTQKKLFPDNATGRKMFEWLFVLEERFPDFFARRFDYPMIILTRI